MAEDTAQKPESSNTTVSRSAFKVTLGGVFSLVAGLGSQVIIASLFGASAEMDAFFTALVIPVFVQTVLISGLSFVFIPAFVREETEGHADNAWALVGTFVWLVGVVLSLVAAAGVVLAPNIIAISAPGLDADKAALTAQMLAILMLSVPLNGLFSLTRGIQNARNSFFVPALAPAIGAVGNIVLLLLLYEVIGPLALACGFVVSTLLQAVVTMTPVVRHGWPEVKPLWDRQVIHMLRLVAPFVLFAILTSSTPLLERFFASDLPDGDLSYLGYANKIAMIVMTLIGAGISTAIFPAMARAYSQHGNEGLIERTEYGVRLSSAVALPALAILSALAVPLVTVLFERGAFNNTATLSVSLIVPLFLISEMTFRMVGNVIVRTFYVFEDTHSVPIVGAISTGIYIVLALLMVDNLGYVGLAAAKPLQGLFGMVVLTALLMYKLRGFHVFRLARDVVLYAGASLIAFGVAWFISDALAFWPALVQLIVAGGSAGVLYLLLLYRIDRSTTLAVLEMTGAKILGKVKILRAAVRPHLPAALPKADKEA